MNIFSRKKSAPSIKALQSKLADLNARRETIGRQLATADVAVEVARAEWRRELVKGAIGADLSEVKGRLRDAEREREALEDAGREIAGQIEDVEHQIADAEDRAERQRIAAELQAEADRIDAAAQRVQVAAEAFAAAIAELEDAVQHHPPLVEDSYSDMRREVSVAGLLRAITATALASARPSAFEDARDGFGWMRHLRLAVISPGIAQVRAPDFSDFDTPKTAPIAVANLITGPHRRKAAAILAGDLPPVLTPLAPAIANAA